MTKASWAMPLFAGSLFLLTSCSNVGAGLSRVHGKVLYKGEPAAGAQIIFHPKTENGGQTQIPTGTAGEDGTFYVFLNKNLEGVPPGQYYIFVRWPEDTSPDPSTGKLRKRGKQRVKNVPEDFLQGRYCDHKNPKFTADIHAGDNELPVFEVQ